MPAATENGRVTGLFPIDRNAFPVQLSLRDKSLRQVSRMGRKKGGLVFNRSLERALQILNAFDGRRRELSMTQISKALSLPTATVLRLCSTLVRYDFLKHDMDSKRYSLGPRLSELGVLVPGPSFRKRRASVSMSMESGGDALEKAALKEDRIGPRGRADRPDLGRNAVSRPTVRRMAVVVMCDAPEGKDVREYIILEPETMFEEIAAFIEKRSFSGRQLAGRIGFGEDTAPARPGKPDKKAFR